MNTAIPTLKFPKYDIPGVDVDRLSTVAKDAAYVAVGLGVLTFQKAQVRRHELTAQLRSTVTEGRQQLGGIAKFVGENAVIIDGRITAAEQRIDQVVDHLASAIPAPVDRIINQMHGAAKAARSPLHGLLQSVA